MNKIFFIKILIILFIIFSAAPAFADASMTKKQAPGEGEIEPMRRICAPAKRTISIKTSS